MMNKSQKPYYQDAHVTLYHGDCLEVDAWLEADVLVTDPPYGMNRAFVGDYRADQVRVTNDHDTTTRDSALRLWGKEKGFLVFGHWKCDKPKNIKHTVIWSKDRMSLGDQTAAYATSHEEIYSGGNTSLWVNKREQSVITAKVQTGDSRPDHPTPKPIGLMEHLVAKTNTGVIADPFAGSGSTLLAARNLGRQAIGVEYEEKYCELIAKRLSQQAFDFGGM
jgi:site-specific DNA-methyltransferase (adenine-specific)